MFFTQLETGRLKLKNIGNKDRDFLFKHFSSKIVARYFFDMAKVEKKSDVDKITSMYLEEEPRTHHRWVIIRKEDDVKIGTCGVHCWDGEKQECEVGYDLYDEFWGNGYMSEAMAAVIKFAENEMNIKTIDAHIFPENTESVKLAKRLGFKDYGKRKNYNYKGQDLEHIIYEYKAK